ncbi:MAG TPA: hypothetical protein VGE52_09780 [Pirellulales bacterium]
MDAPFPFGFPGPTIFYFVLFTLTWAIHTALVDYVLGGAAWLVWTSSTGRAQSVAEEGRAAGLLRDWLPLTLSAAVTVGVAPLLFIQILFQTHFYSAQVLLWIQWTLVGPALILGFYLLYVHKERLLVHRARWLQILNAVVCAACFAFPAACWTANYLLSVNQSIWPKYYAGEVSVFASLPYLFRLGSWFAAAVPTWAAIVALQSWADGADDPKPTDVEPAEKPYDDAGERQTLAKLAFIGLGVASLLGLAYILTLPWSVSGRVFGVMGGPWLLLGIIGVGLQIYSWLQLRNSPIWNRTWLATLSGGVVATLLGAAGVRETIRWATMAADPLTNLEALYAQHADSFGLQGQPLFFTFAALNTAAALFCVWLIRRANRISPDHSAEEIGAEPGETSDGSQGGTARGEVGAEG